MSSAILKTLVHVNGYTTWKIISCQQEQSRTSISCIESESVYGIEKWLETITSAKRNRGIHFLSKDLKKDMYDDKDDPEEKKVLEYLICKLLELHKAKVNLLDSLNYQRDTDYVEFFCK